MLRFRWLPVATRCLLGLIQAAPLAGLLVAVMVDRGPEGESRLSSHLLPLVLWIFDDFAWTCARNSLAFALVGVARLAGSWCRLEEPDRAAAVVARVEPRRRGGVRPGGIARVHGARPHGIARPGPGLALAIFDA